MQKNISLYWWGVSEQKPNFGDSMSPKIVEAVSGRKVIWGDFFECDMISTGSLLQMIPAKMSRSLDFPLHVWGTGYMYPTRPTASVRYRVHAVRGPLTAAAFQRDDFVAAGFTALGDPGLLASLLIAAPSTKQKRIGFVPHFKEREDAVYQEILERIPHSTIIDVTKPDPLEVINDIAQCETIISSSLHGLIVADAFKIPNIWMELRTLHRGGRYKFYDYFLSVGRDDKKPISPSSITDVDALLSKSNFSYLKGIDLVKQGLNKSLHKLVGELST